MQRTTIATTRIARPRPEFIGPYCRWPRRGATQAHRGHPTADAGTSAAARLVRGVLPSI